jgi:plastocyanin
VSIAIISSDKVVFALAIGIPVVVAALMILWSRPRRWQALWALVSVAVIAGTAVVAVAAFRGETPGSTTAAIASSAPCSPKGTKLNLTAAGIAFDPTCLAAPADTAFTVTFENKDVGTPHNVHIFSADPAQDPNAQSLFMGDLVTGIDTATYQVFALPAGTYYFHCDVHPSQMFGTFVSG